MKVEFGSIIVAGSGKIGGHNVSPSRSGFSLRTSSRGRKCMSARQCRNRSDYSNICSIWHSLTPSQVATWNNASESGVSGFQLFLHINKTALLFRSAPSLVFPALPSFNTFYVASAQLLFSSSYLQFTFAGAQINSFYLVVYATMPLSLGRQAVDNDFRLIAALSPRNWSAYNYYPSYAAVFGNVQQSNRAVYFKFKAEKAKRLSPAAVWSGIIS